MGFAPIPYRAVVKVAFDDPPEKARQELLSGLSVIAAELIGDYGCSLGEVETALEEAQGEAEEVVYDLEGGDVPS